ncbi:hypothetical protein HPP92_023251 [Vanilla planifolia]|uniref:USP domain-containing protein n=1 Tax=Vanilla planifolia TaxID=51239 RepID=A0A835PW87_VANPL|nr:hypothetical protein HPP92_023251 [Vanilla planifolia]
MLLGKPSWQNSHLMKKKNFNKGVDSKQAHEKLKEKKKSKDFRKTKDSKSTGYAEQLIFHQETAEKLEFPSSDDGKPVIYQSSAGDRLIDEEEDFKHKVELEEEERKLAETLEYQRRIEDEAKQKHLAEQFKNANETNPGISQELDSVVSHAIVNIVPINHNQAVMHGNAVAVCSKGIQFGGFDVGATIEDHQGSCPEKLNIFSDREDKLRSSQLQRSKGEHNIYDASMEEMQTIGRGLGTANTSGGIKLNGVVRSSSAGKSSSDSNAKKTKKANNQVHSSHRQVEHAQDGLLPCNDQINRHVNEHGSVHLPDKNARVLQHANELPSYRKSLNEVYVNQPHEVAAIEFHDGTGDVGKCNSLLLEDDGDEKFQEDLKKAVRQSLDSFQAEKKLPLAPVLSLSQQHSSVLVTTTEEVANVFNKDIYGTGLKNAVGEYNCFLNVIIQSLWHLRRFRDEFLMGSSVHAHIGEPCVVCALYDIFNALKEATVNEQGEAVAPTRLRIALSNLYPDSNFFQEAQMNDASEVLGVCYYGQHYHCFAYEHEQWVIYDDQTVKVIGGWDDVLICA